jgi:uncharacterized protein (DUF342 family)
VSNPVHRCNDPRKTLELVLSEDRSKLFASVTPNTEYASVTDGELLEEIRKVTSAELIENAVVRDITIQLRQGHGCEARRVAKGTPPSDSRDGKIVWLVRRYTSDGSPDDSSGFVDSFYLGLFENIRNGQKIARVYKPRLGRTGRDALGKDIPPRAPRPYSFKEGRQNL